MLELSRQHLVSQMITSSAARPVSPVQSLAAADPPGRADGALALPCRRLSGRSLEDVIRSRRSGGIARGPVDMGDLGALLAVTASALPESLCKDEVPRGIVFPLVWNVPGVDPGAYRFEPRSHLLLPLPRGSDHATEEALLLQAEHRRAAAVLFLITPLASWLHEAGDRGYRGAALEIGYISDRLYLVAEALGLSYTASGGFSPPMVDRFLGLDGYRFTTFFSFVVGGKR